MGWYMRIWKELWICVMIYDLDLVMVMVMVLLLRVNLVTDL